VTWFHWLVDNWFTALQSLAILSGFAFTCITLRRDERSRWVSNLFELTAHHRDVWTQIFTKPELRRVLSSNPDLVRQPVTENETLFVSFLVLHLNSTHQAIKQRLIELPEGLGADICMFFAHPIPRSVWNELRKFQDKDFVIFVESHFGKK